MISLLVIADDFTGALDTGVQFAKYGIPTIVSTEQKIEYELLDGNIQVAVIDVETRHLESNEAYKKVKDVVEEAKQYGIKYIYKKTDSTLRGNIGSELTASIDGTDSQELMYIPSFPKANRVTINGYLYVNDQSLNITAFANDPFQPSEHNSVKDIIKLQSSLDVVIVSKDDYETFETNRANKSIYVFDAYNDIHLVKIGKELKKRNKLNLTAGCAGFAEILPEILGLKKERILIKEYYNKNKLIISGSINQTSLEQIIFLEKLGYEGIMLNPKQLLKKDYFNTKEGLEFVKIIIDKIRNEDKFIIKTAKDISNVKDCINYSMELNINPKIIHLVIAENIGRMVNQILQKISLGNLIIFGGDTSYGIVNGIGCNAVVPKKEIVTGVVAADVIHDNHDIQIITKAGGFGEKDVFVKIIEYLDKGVQKFRL